jgi:hypothetical protein
VEIVEGRDNLGRVEERGGGVEAAGGAEVGEELAAADVREEHVEEAAVLAAPRQVHEEGMVDFLETALLQEPLRTSGDKHPLD